MTWENVSKRNGIVWMGRESTFGTAASNMIALLNRADPPWPNAGATQQMIGRQDSLTSRRAYQTPVKGMKSGSPVALSVDVKPTSGRLNAAASPVAFSNASALSHQLLWRAAMGGELTPAAGTTVDSYSAPDVTVASGHGSRFAVGQWLLYEATGGALSLHQVTGHGDRRAERAAPAAGHARERRGDPQPVQLLPRRGRHADVHRRARAHRGGEQRTADARPRVRVLARAHTHPRRRADALAQRHERGPRRPRRPLAVGDGGERRHGRALRPGRVERQRRAVARVEPEQHAERVADRVAADHHPAAVAGHPGRGRRSRASPRARRSRVRSSRSRSRSSSGAGPPRSPRSPT
jgi:hypothetical protein